MKIPVMILPASMPARPSREPLTFGVPLPRGAVQAPGPWAFVDAGGRIGRADTVVLDRWGDGSARWVLVDTQIEPAMSREAGAVIDTAPSAGALANPGHRIRIIETADTVVVETGAARFTMRRGGRVPFDQVDIDGAPTLEADASGGLVVTDATGHRATARIEATTVEHRGDVRAAIRVDAGVKAGGGRRLVAVTRIEFFAGLAAARIRCTIRNPDRATHPGNYWDLGDPGSLLLKDVSMAWTLAPRDGETRVALSAETTAPWTAGSSPLELYQDSSGGENWLSTNHVNRERRVPNAFRGYRLRFGRDESAGLRATPAAGLSSGPARMGAAVPAFWQNFPRAIEVRDRTLVVRFFPGQHADLHELQGGEQKTHELYAAFGPDAGAGGPLDWGRAPTRAMASASWIESTGAVDFLAPLDAGHAAIVDAAIEGPDTFDHKREIIDQYGWRHYGEIYGDHEAVGHTGLAPLVSHYNNQYDPVAGFALQFLRTGDVRWYAAMDELAAHVIDVDIYHTDRDKSAYNGGLFWHTYHYGDADTATHRTYPRRNTGTVFGGGPSADHNYPTGLMLRYFLTGDPASREAAVGLAQYVLDLDNWRLSPFRWLSRADTGRTIFTPPDFFGPARSSGNSLNALVDGHRVTGDPAFLAKADQLVRRVVHPKDDLVKSRLDEPENRWFYAMFLQALGKYLQHKAERGLIDEAYAHGRASLIAYARWMADHEYPYLEKPEKLEHPTETWAAQDIRKSDIFCFAAMHASGAERDRFIERADFFHRTSVDTLTSMPTRTFARPVIVLLTSGLLRPWFERHRDAALPAPSREPDLGLPERFVPQRAQAERRAKLIAAAGVVVAVALVVAAAIWIL
jgi:hypothetical protein